MYTLSRDAEKDSAAPDTSHPRRRRGSMLAAALTLAALGGAIAVLASDESDPSGLGSSATTVTPSTVAISDPAMSETPTTAIAAPTPLDTVAPAGVPTTEAFEHDDEAGPIGEPVVTQTGASLEPPTPEPPPAPAADEEPIPLDLIEEGAPALPTHDPVSVPPYDPPPGPDDLSSNAPGCASNCIVDARLIKGMVSADLRFEIKTNVAARIRVWVSRRPPMHIGDHPAFPGRPATADSGSKARHWETNLDDLLYDTKYFVIVRADDHYGNSQYATTSIRTITPPGPGQLAGNGDGCYYQCITSAFVALTEPDRAEIVVISSENATFDFAVSQQEPGTIAGNPLLPHDQPIEVLQANPHGQRVSVGDLEPDTRYHIVVRVTDDAGFTAHAVGEFRTPPLPPPDVEVLIVYEKIEVLYDGDAADVNRGEIRFLWGFEDPHYQGQRSEEKLKDGAVVDLPAGSGRWVRVPADGELPMLLANASERDSGDVDNLCLEGEDKLWEYPSANEDCDRTTNVAKLESQPLSWLSELATCNVFGFTGTEATDRCYPIASPEFGDEFVQFRVIVRFHVG